MSSRLEVTFEVLRGVASSLLVPSMFLKAFGDLRLEVKNKNFSLLNPSLRPVLLRWVLVRLFVCLTF